jgi:hypothetical protein
MKQFTTIKVGYTYSRMYGCSGEYFTTIIVTDNGIESLSHYGMYGSEDRVNKALKDKGFEERYVSSDYGQMSKKDLMKNLFKTETMAIGYIAENY